MYWGNHQTIITITNTSTNDMQLSQIPILTAMFTDLNWSNAETTVFSVYQWLLSSPLFRWWPGMSSLSTASTEQLVNSSSTNILPASSFCHNCPFRHRPHHHYYHVRLWPGWQAGQHQLHDQEDQGAHPRRPWGPQLQVMMVMMMMVMMVMMVMSMDTLKDPSYTMYRWWWWWF